MRRSGEVTARDRVVIVVAKGYEPRERTSSTCDRRPPRGRTLVTVRNPKNSRSGTDRGIIESLDEVSTISATHILKRDSAREIFLRLPDDWISAM